MTNSAYRRLRRLIGAWAALIGAGVLLACTEQDGPNPETAPVASEDGQLIRIYEMVLRPDAATEWSRMQREEAIPALLAGGYPWVDVWRAGGAGNAYYRSILVPLNDLSELDETAVFTRALGQEQAQELLQRHRELVTSIDTKIVRARTDLGFGSPPDVSGIGVLTTVTIANGRTQEFEQRLRTSVATELKWSNVASLRVGQVLFGGEANQYFTLLEFRDTGDHEQTTVRQAASGHPTTLEWALGPVGLARVADEPNSPVIAIERSILQYDEELSAR